jgi:asparagine synthase (glutamine-hydrolysing)
MCGLTGYLGRTDLSVGAHTALLLRMSERLLHRGPDSGGVWCDPEAGFGLAHRRLAVVDLSPAGAQPMHGHSGRYVLAYNGEVYNHLELRSQLERERAAPLWRGHSDTETLLACAQAWGIEETAKRAVGMFAMALWDREARALTLVRDRMGEKPLYYGWQGSGATRSFLFGSELVALRSHPSFAAEVDRDSICMLLRYSCIPAPWSVYRGVSKLPPACLLTISLTNPEPVVHKYWSVFNAVRAGREHPFGGDPKEAVDELERIASEAVRGQMVADVPLGAFLSGGIDSSTIAALMQKQSHRPIKTFTIGFSEPGFDEAVYAKSVARHLRTEHTELYVRPEQARDVIPRLPELYCEPFSDSSQIPTFLVSQLARSHVTVALSGDAGDELFAGYTRYGVTASLWRRLSSFPVMFRRAAARLLEGVPPGVWDRWGHLLPGGRRFTAIGYKVHKGATVLTSNSAQELYLRLVSHHLDPLSYVTGGHESSAHAVDWDHSDLRGLDVVEKMMVFDSVTYLPDDILVKVDRAAMSVSLETRVPYLDHRLVEFAWTLPLTYKLRDGVTKWPLRQVLYRYVPRDLVERPKAGFGIPLAAWLRGPLRQWVEELIDEGRLRREGYFEASAVRRLWDQHLSGRRNLAYHLWDILMFQAWQQSGRVA